MIGIQTSAQKKASNLLCMLLILCGDIHLNPGPVSGWLTTEHSVNSLLAAYGSTTSIAVSSAPSRAMDMCVLSLQTNLISRTVKRKVDISAANPLMPRFPPCSEDKSKDRATLKHQRFRLFQTVNHAKVL